jgi:CRISPR-associated protein Csm4
MQAISITIKPQSAFGTPLRGDTLFGQLCWAIHNRYGVARLTDLLSGYTKNKPFLIASDAFPQDYLPKPSLPSCFFADIDLEKRKTIKKQIWMPISKTALAIKDWQKECKADKDIARTEKRVQQHNSINRLTGTTGEEGFAPYGMLQTWYQTNTQLQCHFLLDSERFKQTELEECLQDIGNFGFGRDASVGLGKFSLIESIATQWHNHPQAKCANDPSPYCTARLRL